MIELMELKIKSASSHYYLTHSLIGTTIFDHYSDDYQRSQSVEFCVAEILAEEKSCQIQKNKLIRALNRFNEEISMGELKRLRIDLYADLGLLEKALNWIEELEFYYDNSIHETNEVQTELDSVGNKFGSVENDLFAQFELI